MADENHAQKKKNNSEMEMKETRIEISFSLRNEADKLAEAIEKLLSRQIILRHISSEPNGEECKFSVTCDYTGHLKDAMEDLIQFCINFEIIKLPDFPEHARDLHQIKPKIMKPKKDLEKRYKCFTDDNYEERRSKVINISGGYKYGGKIPTVVYTEDEQQIWREVYTKLVNSNIQHACERFNRNFKLLENECVYTSGTIPQLEDVSNFLQGRTGFRLRPAPGFISSRDFLAALAFRTFYSTQYIRHPDEKEYTPVPDVCHELLGHVPLLADEEFAQFVQHIGLASLGAPLDYIKELSRFYWFTVEVGLWKEEGVTKVYGAAILSSAQELGCCLNDKAQKMFHHEEACKTDPNPYENQKCYFVAESFEDLKEQMRVFANKSQRPFDVKSTQSVEVDLLKKIPMT